MCAGQKVLYAENDESWERMIMASRKDVAKLAGVSPAVVSYVLNESNYVSKEKREAVLKAVRQLNYQPSYFGRMLKSKRTNNLALICDDIRGELFSEIASLIESEIYRKGYTLFLSSSHKRRSFLQDLTSHKFDGIFLATSVYHTEEINYLASSGTPVVLYEAHRYEGLDPGVGRIHVDYENGAYLLTNRLLSRGIDKAAFFPPYQSELELLREDDYRFRGYVRALREHGREIQDSLICYDNSSYAAICEKAEAICQEARQMGERIGLVVGSDYLAVRIMNYLTDKGLFQADQVLIAGMDYTECGRLVRPVLTSLGFSKSEIAAEVIRRLIPGEEKENGKAAEAKMVPTYLVEGMSG